MLREIAAGALVGMVVLGLPLACTNGGLSPSVRCQLDALKVLPSDPMMVTVRDAIDVAQRIRECKRAHPDAGQ
jgi:hypothetical protein